MVQDGALDWTGAMYRALDCAQQFRPQPHQRDTHLEPKMMAIGRAVAERQELREAALPAAAKGLRSVQAKRSDLLSCCGCKRRAAGVPREELKEFLMFAWNLERWTRVDDLEAEALCDRVCLVQRNLRLKFVAACLPRVTSSFVGIAFVFLRLHFTCTCLALGSATHAEAREIRMWAAIAFLDALEVGVIGWTHWRHNLQQDDHTNWRWVRRVLWSGWPMLLAAAVATHILQDTYYAFYEAAF